MEDLYVGQRVRLCQEVKGPPCREGVVVEVRPWGNGAIVRHDRADLDLEAAVGQIVEAVTSVAYNFALWGWDCQELEPVADPS